MRAGPVIAKWVPLILYYCFAVFLVSLTATYIFVGDRTPLGEFFTIWPPLLWVFLLLPAMALVGWLTTKKRFFILLIGLIIFLALTVEWRSMIRTKDSNMPYRLDYFGAEKAESAHSATIRLMVWNMGGAIGVEDFRNRIESTSPDMCFLQETSEELQSLQPQTLMDPSLGYGWFICDGDKVILSKLPLRSKNIAGLRSNVDCQIAIVDQTGNPPIIVANVHLPLPSLILNPLSAENRRLLVDSHDQRAESISFILRSVGDLAMRESTDSLIVAGDFNTPGEAKSLNPLKAILSDAWTDSGNGWGATFPEQYPISRIDQCWISHDLVPISAWVTSGAPSDHRMLIVELLVNLQQASTGPALPFIM